MNDEIRKKFNDGLNRHGYGFHSRILQELKTLREQKESEFVLETIEFPTSVRGSNTRIDIVLSRGLGAGVPDFLLAECKRANPAMANWCVARYPMTKRNTGASYEPVIVEHATWLNTSFKTIGNQRGYATDIAHIGLEVRTGRPGDKAGESGRAIEDACSQVLRGLNGFIEGL